MYVHMHVFNTYECTRYALIHFKAFSVRCLKGKLLTHALFIWALLEYLSKNVWDFEQLIQISVWYENKNTQD